MGMPSLVDSTTIIDLKINDIQYAESMQLIIDIETSQTN